MQKILIRLYKIYLILLSLKFYRFLFYRKYSIWKNENIFKKYKLNVFYIYMYSCQKNKKIMVIIFNNVFN
ncbi:hypothetical protein PFNF135_03015 [Plasmodium falciparum NF135/5.C10]|uniref:Uncharacterized protein n=1 Tax=Plasmodium falciparum NF135/5.C10 TaxID=1036726 RepID=W4IGA1_PLAFA|nr:hypothetical protein PFNF135_03015 [Plasmodium falciparum NF135/5.C10]